MRVVREVSIEHLVVRSAQIVALENVDNFENEYATGFSVDPLLLYLIAGDVGEELFFSLEVDPDLVEDLIGAE